MTEAQTALRASLAAEPERLAVACRIIARARLSARPLNGAVTAAKLGERNHER